MSKLRGILKKLPFYMATRKALLEIRERRQLKHKDTAQIFNDIFRDNAWNGRTSFSGRGSDPDQTKTISEELPKLFQELCVATVLDAPCGDFRWMQHVDLSGVDYTGADIVGELVRQNTRQYGNDYLRFQELDLIRDKLPNVDLIFCRDCLVHLSFEDIDRTLANMCDSRSSYLLTTTFPERKKNKDIKTGQWRMLNLEIAPFSLPSPLKLINEGCTEGDGCYADKSLGLWRIVEIEEHLARH